MIDLHFWPKSSIWARLEKTLSPLGLPLYSRLLCERSEWLNVNLESIRENTIIVSSAHLRRASLARPPILFSYMETDIRLKIALPRTYVRICAHTCAPERAHARRVHTHRARRELRFIKLLLNLMPILENLSIFAP